MTQLLYPVFYRQYGVRRLQSLLGPKPMTVLGLPRDSMLHFYSNDENHLDIDTSKLYLGSNTKRIIIDFPEELTSTLGNPRSHPVIIKNFFRPFLIENKKFRFLKDGYKRVDDSLTLFIENYSYIDKIYKYPVLPMTGYHKWFNMHKTIFANISKICTQANKNHFVFCDMADELPSFGLLNIYNFRSTPAMLKVFDTPEKLFILHLFRWIGRGKDTGETIFDGLDIAHFPKVNLVFNTKDGRSCVINLGYLNSWLKGQGNTTEFSSVSQITSLQMQKVFLKFLMSLESLDTTVPVDPTANAEPIKGDASDISDEKELEQERAEYDQQHGDAVDDGVDDHEYQDALSYANRIQTNSSDLPVTSYVAPIAVKDDDATLDQVLNNDESLDDMLKNIESDIQTLDALTVRKLKDKGIRISDSGEIENEVIQSTVLPLHELQQKVYNFESPQSALKRQIEAQADYGLISASDYKNFMRDMEAYKVSMDPYGSGNKTSQAMLVSPEDIVLSQDKTTIEASDMVQDKTMLQSSLLAFDQDYVSNVMKKDMLGMLDGLQKSGLSIRKHEIETDHSALGSYDYHTLEFKPVDGQVSTVRFRVPKISEDGTFLANGNKYFLRKQRVDVPIRKIKPTEVALTSYYGKTFVRLNSKKANSSLEWIIKELNLASMADHDYIKRVNPAKVFDNNFEAPYIYNALADNFKSIITAKYTLVFDHSERVKLVNEVQLQALEVNGSRVVGYTNRKEPIIVDKDDIFSVVDQNSNLTKLGDIYHMLQLDTSKAPVDFTEVNIFSKSVPVAIVLGFVLGFNNLLRLLQVKYRTVEGRQQKNLESHEYTVTFKDVSYIFSRKDKVASMILAGYNEYEKLIKQFEADDFNHKDVYLNLLESKGLGSVYIRELELNQQLFVDPITKEILEQMKEPVTFNGLLIRATEMMQKYHHPDSQDMSAMRIRGYERIPGAVYKEMVGAIRQYRNRNIAGKSKVDISPYQIWTNIMKDPALKLVEDINPIQNLKEFEIVTYVGEGGRGKDSMNKASRAYHPNDMGIVSEATVDSSDVGVNAYLSANPEFKNLRGLPILGKKAKTPSSLVSTSAMLTPGADKDD